jgi:hypothetical protein
MSLVNLVSRVQCEADYIDQLMQSLRTKSNAKIMRLRDQFEADVKSETRELEEVIKELAATKNQLLGIIEEPAPIKESKPKLVVNEV